MKKLLITSNAPMTPAFIAHVEKQLKSRDSKTVTIELDHNQRVTVQTVDVPRRSFWEYLV